MMTPERLAQIEAEANAATEGPWEAAENHIEVRGCLVAAVQLHGNVRTMMATGEQYSHVDAAFIANARQNIPDLIAEVRRLQAENEALQTKALPKLPDGYTWDDPDPHGPSFRAPNGVICCCTSYAQAVEVSQRWAARG